MAYSISQFMRQPRPPPPPARAAGRGGAAGGPAPAPPPPPPPPPPPRRVWLPRTFAPYGRSIRVGRPGE
ncbi:hypothetical protein AAHZ94_12695 [Streptomyces sp. HSW2009]|uniref:hypothetical protein n=1 Tax=Streptomyces sp. HSW2009 TaxID=3142890 RepID=UPI0032EAD2EE